LNISPEKKWRFKNYELKWNRTRNIFLPVKKKTDTAIASILLIVYYTNDSAMMTLPNSLGFINYEKSGSWSVLHYAIRISLSLAEPFTILSTIIGASIVGKRCGGMD
jgi:hypothetical protein